MKRKLAIILLSSLALSLVACGKDKDKTTETTEIGGLTEVTTTETVQDTTEQGYVAPEANTTEEVENNSLDYYFSLEDRVNYIYDYFYSFDIQIKQLGVSEFEIYEDGSGYYTLVCPYTNECISMMISDISLDDAKKATISNNEGLNHTEWSSEVYNNEQYEHISFTLEDGHSIHYFIHTRENGFTGILSFYTLYNEEWQMAMNSMVELNENITDDYIDNGIIDQEITTESNNIESQEEVTTEVQESETSETAE